MFCPRCGKPVETGALQCAACGADLRPYIGMVKTAAETGGATAASTAANTAAAPAAAQGPEKQPKPKKRRRRIVIGSLCAVLCVILAAVGLIVYDFSAYNGENFRQVIRAAGTKVISCDWDEPFAVGDAQVILLEKPIGDEYFLTNNLRFHPSGDGALVHYLVGRIENRGDTPIDISKLYIEYLFNDPTGERHHDSVNIRLFPKKNLSAGKEIDTLSPGEEGVIMIGEPYAYGVRVFYAALTAEPGFADNERTYTVFLDMDD